MKKIFASLFVLFSVVLTLYAGNDRFGSERFQICRSSVTLTADISVLIASGNVVLCGASADTPGTSSKIEFFDSIFSTIGAKRLAAPLDTTAKTERNYNVFTSSGLMYSSTGTPTAQITIKWDFIYNGMSSTANRNDP